MQAIHFEIKSWFPRSKMKRKGEMVTEEENKKETKRCMLHTFTILILCAKYQNRIPHLHSWKKNRCLTFVYTIYNRASTSACEVWICLFFLVGGKNITSIQFEFIWVSHLYCFFFFRYRFFISCLQTCGVHKRQRR